MRLRIGVAFVLFALVLACRPGAAAGAGDTADVSLRAKIGQMILIGFRGSAPDSPWVQTVLKQIAGGEVGGVMFLGHNVKDKASAEALNAALKAANPALPPLIAVDQEGGRIERLTAAAGFEEIPSARDVARTMSAAKAFETYSSLASDLAGWGFNLNLGPVADLNVNPENPIIGRLDRSFSADAKSVGDYADAFVRAHRRNGVLTALKHFPGHGSSVADSHRTLADVSATWSDKELTPYRTLIACGDVDMVMVGHIFARALDPVGHPRPASLSPEVIGGVLRGQLGFDGVVISDDLQMDAVTENYGFDEAVVQAVRAGNTILTFANYEEPDIDLPGKVIAILERAAATDPQVRANIDRSYELIVALKARLPKEP